MLPETQENKGFHAPVMPPESQATATVTHRVTQAVTHTATRTTKSGSAIGRRGPGLYLLRRGPVFYFRRRSPARIRKIGGKSFLCFSLRTHFPREAMKRAAALLVAIETAEREIMKDRQKDLSPEEVQAILDEVVRTELGRIIDSLDVQVPRTHADVEHRIAALEAEIAELKNAARLRDFGPVGARVVSAAERLAIALEAPLQGALGRQAIAKLRALKEAEASVEDGEDIADAAEDLIEDHLSGDLGKVREAPLTLGRAISCALEHATTSDMRNKYAATGRIALEFLGDVSLHTIDADKVKKLMTFIFRLPRNHGKKHGKNRFRKDGDVLSKFEEIRQADENDRAHLDMMAARTDISELEKRSQLRALLVPRQTPINTQHHLNRLRGIFKAAAKHLGYRGECRFMTDKELSVLMRDARPTEDLNFHHTMPKTRECWSKERLQKLLLSPHYTGCFSRHRRWRPGRVIVRDALYWVPLILMTIGSRIEELLRLNKSGVVLRDGTFCFALNIEFEDDGKTSSAKRYIPVPDLILRLGFVEWARGLPGGPLAPLFPEIVQNAAVNQLSDIFSKRCATLFRNLSIKDWNEDLYALRKTLSTSLSKAGTTDGKRQAIAGHSSGSILNIHYTSHSAEDLKKEIDQVDFKLCVAFSEQHGFPIIVGSELLAEPQVEVQVVLAGDGSAASFELSSTGGDEPELQVTIFDSPGDDAVGQVGAICLPMDRAARSLYDALRGRQPRRMADPIKQKALDYLLMLGCPRSDHLAGVADVQT
ncbi:MAG: DUF6538 domain-containing protein [Paracoccaceae bacterium]